MVSVMVDPAKGAKLAQAKDEVAFQAALDDLLNEMGVMENDRSTVREAMAALPRLANRPIADQTTKAVIAPHDPLPKILHMDWWGG